MSASTRNKHSKHGNTKLDIDKDEFERIRKALDNEEFRKLFFDYVDEIQDPENRKLYEQEIAQLEKERGVDITFIHPKPGFVVKTVIDGEIKCFINIASSVEVARPNNEMMVNPDTGERGLSWSIPMAQAPPHDDVDAKQKLCKVYDVVFHPDALHLGKRNAKFRQCLLDTALDGVEREYNVKLDRANLKFPKLDYKGIARPTVIRKLAKNASEEDREPHPLEHMYPKKPDTENPLPKVLPMKTKITAPPKFTVPKYSIKQSHAVDLSEYTDELDAKLQATVPSSLVVEIELPLLNSTADCQLDVTEKSVYLLSERHGAKYRLKLDLPYKVDDKAGNARFDTEQRRLCITLPVVRCTARQQRQMHDSVRLLSREDSGVELSSHSEHSESPAEEEETEVEGEGAAETSDAIVEQSPATNAFPPTAEVSPRSFLQHHLHYQLPAKFDCNVLDNVMAFVLHVPNVQPDSIQTLQLPRSLHLQFASMGSGYYPTHYALFVQLSEEVDPQLVIDHVEADASDENVVLRLYMSAGCETMPSYLAGSDSNDLKEYALGHHKDSDDEELECKQSLQVSMDHNELEQAVEVTIAPPDSMDGKEKGAGGEPHPQAEVEEEHEQLHQHKKPNKKQRKRNKRSLSESACEDLKAEEQHHAQQQKQQSERQQMKHSTPEQVATQPMATLKLPQRKQRSFSECNDSSGSSSVHHRGILKRFSRYGPRPSMSDSCSSIDDYSSSYSCSVDAAGAGFSQSFGGIPEERVGGDDAGLSESCKKTVRFNDHIMKQVFRLDSSILGQRKKNQKRRDCKLRAQQRRLSEGDSADYEDSVVTGQQQQQSVHKTAGNAQYFKQQNHRHGKDNKKHAFHDSGLDLTGGGSSTKCNKNYNEEENKRNEADAKNAMMFEMDEDDDDDEM
ncbi:protein kintoun [Drosophila sulfurigaster albostrigata]|uniref:protein kintoun n=1 Tax=Drosophila sulfurigaster albostrigata TaxID=89887 RepID=UPI002D21A5DF|nr:protein kintoun [Drosophila sulfurigaster albostrigata]